MKNIFLLITLMISISACQPTAPGALEEDLVSPGKKSKGSQTTSPNKVIYSATLNSNQVVVSGRNLNDIDTVHVSDGSNLYVLQVFSTSANTVVAKFTSAVNLSLGSLLKIMVADAVGQVTANVSLDLAALGSNGAESGDVLKWNGSSWEPSADLNDGSGGSVAITGVTTADASGLTGGGTAGTLNLTVNTGTTGDSSKIKIPFFNNSNILEIDSTAFLKFSESTNSFSFYNDGALHVKNESDTNVLTMESNGDVEVGGNLLINGTLSGASNVCLSDGTNCASSDVSDGSVTSLKLSDNAVSSSKVADGAITSPKISNDAITSLKILDGAVTSDKLAVDAVTADKIGEAQVGSSELASGAVTDSKLASGISATKIGANTNISNTEYGYLDGVTSAIQTQLDNKQAADADLGAIAALTPSDGNFLVGDGSSWSVESGATARISLGLGASDSPSFSGLTVNTDTLFVDSSNDNVGLGTSTPNTASILDVTSTNKGVLLPRMTTSQRDGIASPSTGLIIYNTTENKFNYYNGSDWTEMGSGGGGAPVGTITAHGGASAPSGWLIANGAAVSRTIYASLFSVIGTNFGYGDNSTTFNLPDLRGKFVRGRASGSGHDPDRNSRVACATGGNTGDNVGSCQSDNYKSHRHLGGAASDVNYAYQNGSSTGSTRSWRLGHDSGSGNVYPYTSYSGGNDTRPENVYVTYIIKATDSGAGGGDGGTTLSDADTDSSIDLSTDDTIAFNIGGSSIGTIDSSGLTLSSGSSFTGSGSGLTDITLNGTTFGSTTSTQEGLNIPTASTAPTKDSLGNTLSTDDKGQFYFNTTDNKLQVWDGDSWEDIGSGGTSGAGVYASMRSSYEQSLATTVSAQQVAFQVTDSSNLMTVNLAANKITVEQTGAYHINFNLIGSADIAMYSPLIYKNGSVLIRGGNGSLYPNATDAVGENPASVSMSTIVSLTAGDYLTFYAKRETTSGGVEPISSAHVTVFKMSGGVENDFADADLDTKIQVEKSTDEDKIRFDTAGTERAVIDSSGLQVVGDVKVGNSGSGCSTANEGAQRYNSTFKWMEYCNGTEWDTINGRWRITNSLTSNSSVVIPNNVIATLCGDDDGCSYVLTMYNWAGGEQRTTSTIKYTFYYHIPTGRYRTSAGSPYGEVAGTTGDSTERHIAQVWSCYFSDYAVSNGLAQNDGDNNFHLLNWTEYNNETCGITIYD